jgi:hypothetical protein
MEDRPGVGKVRLAPVADATAGGACHPARRELRENLRAPGRRWWLSVRIREGVLHGFVERHRLALREVGRRVGCLFEFVENPLVSGSFRLVQPRAGHLLKGPNASPETRSQVAPPAGRTHRRDAG